jgi:hypothetical protein
MNRTIHEIEPEEVMAYLDGELEASRASEVAAHMAGCAECGAAAAEFRAISSQLANWSIAGPSPAMTEAIERAAQTTKRSEVARATEFGPLSLSGQWFTRRPWKFAAAFGAVAVVLLAAVTFVGSSYYATRTAGRYSVDNSFSYAPAAKPQATDLSGGGGGEDRDAATQQASSLAHQEKEPTPAGPMIARTASMNLVVAKLDVARALLEKLLARHRGFASAMTLDKSNDAAPSLDATLQVPSADLDEVLGELRGLGRVTTESQQGEDVSDQHVDLAARLHNEREAEQRLIEILRTRTGKLSDVVEVEEQISQTRGEIEQMEAQLANLDKRVAYASIKLQIAEEYKAPAATGNGSVGLRLRNAIVGGYRDAVESLIGLVAFLLSAGPMLLLWSFILFWPARALWKRRGFLRAAFGKS